MFIDRVLGRRAPHLAAPFHGLIKQHRELSASTRALAAAVGSVLVNFAVPRAPLVALGRDFVARCREQMRKEDADLFPNAGKLLDLKDWGAIDAELDALNDPMFGPSVQAHFERQRAEIDELTREAQ